MVSPISAVTSRTPSVRPLSRVAPVTRQAEPVEEAAGPTTVVKTPPPGPGLRDPLPAGYRNFSAPLGAAASEHPSDEASLMSAYGPSSAALSGLPRLVGERPPLRVVVREAQAAIRSAAEARGESAAEFLDEAEIVPRSRLPSRNAPDAAPTIRAALLVRDGEHDTATIDIYLTKTGQGVFEATSYDRDFAAASGGFPYAAPPLSVDRVVFDPAYQAIVAGQPRRRSGRAAGSASPLGSLAVVAASGVATVLAVTLTLAADKPAFAAITALLGAVGFVYAVRSRSGG